MQKIFLLACICLASFFFVASAYSAATNDFNSDQFTITLNNMDPLKSNHSGDDSEVAGIGAFKALLGKVTNILLFTIPMLAGISLLIAGYFYIFSAGDSEKAGRAKANVSHAIQQFLRIMT